MPVNYYPNKTFEELEALLTALQNRQTKGPVVEVIAGGIKTRRDFSNANGSKVDVEILRVLYSLYLITKDATNVPADEKYANPYKQRITRTRANYNISASTLP